MSIQSLAPGHIFFYGTLMQGFDLRRRIGIDRLVELVGPATTRAALFDLGSYPGAIKGNGSVRGELYRMLDPRTLLLHLDAVEGYERDAAWRSLYVREAVTLTTDRGADMTAWVYFYARCVGDAVWIPSGDYRTHVERRRGLCYDLTVSLMANPRGPADAGPMVG